VWKDAPEQWVSVTSPKTIIDEIRFAVVDGKVITGSTYRVNKRTNMGELDESINDPLYEWVQSVVDIWQPEKAFVIDAAVTKEGDKKIIEINTINASGLYDMNIEKIIEAIQEMES
jgi:hypothetical protein